MKSKQSDIFQMFAKKSKLECMLCSSRTQLIATKVHEECIEIDEKPLMWWKFERTNPLMANLAR